MDKRVFRSVGAAAAAITMIWLVRLAAGQPPGQTPPPPFTIAQPSTNTVSGTCHLAVSTTIKSIASVEYRLGSRRLGIATRPPFELTWNSAYAADGSSALQAIARDSLGNPVVTVERIFVINNFGNFIDSAAPLPKVLSGTVTLSVSGKDGRYYPAEWLAYIDGEMLTAGWTDNLGKHAAGVTMRVDTTRFANGRHELYVAMHSDYWQPGHQAQKSFYNWRGAFERVVEIDNGHTLMDIAAEAGRTDRPDVPAALYRRRRGAVRRARLLDRQSPRGLSVRQWRDDCGTTPRLRHDHARRPGQDHRGPRLGPRGPWDSAFLRQWPDADFIPRRRLAVRSRAVRA